MKERKRRRSWASLDVAKGKGSISEFAVREWSREYRWLACNRCRLYRRALALDPAHGEGEVEGVTVETTKGPRK